MSFKRDGDDEALLRNLKMRRVGDLLSEHIPDDEAKLLSNGRLTCLICSHRPIFDTFSVLGNHRKGKRHLEELGKYLKHKRELECQKLKDEQHQYLTVMGRHSNKKEKCANFQRKPILSISLPRKVSSEKISTSENVPSVPSQVRHYLKEIQRKRALQKTVERCRETYPSSTLPPIEKSSCMSTQASNSGYIQKKNANTTVNMDRDLQLRMSGWIKSSEGKWMKDPEVEFDSDEEIPEDPS